MQKKCLYKLEGRKKNGVEGKRLLVLGAGRGQIGLYKAAKEMGITTIAGTNA